MKVLILTKGIYATQFIAGLTYQYPEHEFFIWTGDDSVWERIKEYEIGISFMYTYKVPAEQVNTHTWINFHPAPLPEYKGRNLCYHAIMNGERWFGVTVHYMDENFDTGDIIEVFKFPIHDWYTAQDLSEKAINTSKSVFQEYLPIILEGRIPQAKKNVGGQYYPKEPIDDYLFLSDQDELKKQIRAITYGSFYPKLDVNGVIYKIVRDE